MEVHELKTKLLVVDDDESVRTCLKRYLSKDFDVCAASDGKKALGLYEVHKPKIIITDLAMPIMNGDQLCREIRKLDLDCKIFAMSGCNNRLTNSSQINIGFTDFITKPFELAKILSLMKEVEAEL